MRRIAIALFACLMIAMSAATAAVSAQPIAYGHSIGGTGMEFGTAIATDSAGNVYIVGQTTDSSMVSKGLLVMFDQSGDRIWDRLITSQWTDSCTLVDVAVTESGEIYVVGHTNPTVFVAKFSGQGYMRWSTSLYNMSYPTAIAADPVTGGYVVAGGFYESSVGAVAAFNSDGSWRWMRYNENGTAYPYGLAVDGNGNTYAFYDRGFNGSNVGMVKFDGSGNVLAQTMLDTPLDSEYTWDMQLSPSGALVMCGSHWGDGQKALVAKMGLDLKPIWTEYLSTVDYALDGYRVATPSDGSIYLMCWADYNATAILHLDASGAFISGTVQSDEGTSSMLRTMDIVARQGGGLLQCGVSRGAPQGEAQAMTGVMQESTNGTWTKDNIAWTSQRVWLGANPVWMFAALYPVDDFGTDMGYQAWWGAVDIPAWGLIVEIGSSPIDINNYSFTANITGGTGPYSCHWLFGDGTDSNLTAPMHAFSPGGWWVQVFVTDSLGAQGYASTHVQLSGPPQVNQLFASPNNATVGDYIYFVVDAYDPDGGDLAYQWDFGDNTTEHSIYPFAVHTYQWPGFFEVTVLVTDSDGESASGSTWVYINETSNQPPNAYFTYSPYYPAVGSDVFFNGGYSSDYDGWIVSYVWEFGDGYTAYGSYVNHTFYTEGYTWVTLTVTDDDGASASYTTEIYVSQNLPPVAMFYWSPEVPSPYDWVYFDPYGSYDPDGWIEYFEWDFGDGTWAYSSYNYSVEHRYYQGGDYAVTLTVHDNRGATASITKWLHVDLPPVAVIEAPDVGKVGTAVTFSGLGSYDPDGNVTSYHWNFGDGYGWTEGPQVTHTYAAPGSYSVYLDVMDEYGASSDTEFTISILEPKSPVAVVGYSPYPIVIGAECTFDASASVDPDGSISTCIWQFGDGSVGNGTQASHVYRYAGQYVVRLVVIDEDGLSAETTTTVTVISSKPRTTDLSPGVLLAGSPVVTFGGALGFALGAVGAIAALTLFRYTRRNR